MSEPEGEPWERKSLRERTGGSQACGPARPPPHLLSGKSALEHFYLLTHSKINIS